MSVINCLPELAKSESDPICDSRFTREVYDHHINFVAAQDIVYQKLKMIKDMLPMKSEKHCSLYPHLGCDVYFIRKNNKPRARTCR